MGTARVHWVHEVLSPWLLTFGVAMLLLAHYWNRTRHHGGGVPWVLSILWLSTWVMLVNVVIFAVEEGLVGHEEGGLGVNWPHLVQTGNTVTFLALLAVIMASVIRYPRIDLSRQIGRLLGARRWQAYALGHLISLGIGLGLAAAAALTVNKVG